MRNTMNRIKAAAVNGYRTVINRAMRREPGIDGILVTVGLCVIALLLCIVMKTELSDFITNLVDSMQAEAQKVLSGTRV